MVAAMRKDSGNAAGPETEDMGIVLLGSRDYPVSQTRGFLAHSRRFHRLRSGSDGNVIYGLPF